MTYKTKFTELVNEIITNIKRRKTEESLRFAYNGVGYDLLDRGARVALIRSITDDYVANHGELPDAAELERLADAILDEELTDTNEHKVSQTEYPFLSNIQLDRRRVGKRGEERTNMRGEKSLSEAEHVGTDGRDYRFPNRRKRSIDELIFVDELAIADNRKRSVTYRLNTSPSVMLQYKTDESDKAPVPVRDLTPKFIEATSVLGLYKSYVNKD